MYMTCYVPYNSFYFSIFRILSFRGLSVLVLSYSISDLLFLDLKDNHFCLYAQQGFSAESQECHPRPLTISVGRRVSF